MEKAVLLALITVIVDEAVKGQLSDIPRGPRGHTGPKGRDFSLEESLPVISNSIQQHLNTIKEELKLRFSDLTEEDRQLLKLNFSELSPEEKEELVGPRGYKGDKGEKGDNGKNATHEQIREVLNTLLPELKLKFSDLTDEDIQQLKGEKGERGEKGQNASYEQIVKAVEELTPQLKLQFSDLTDEDKQQLKGEKGERGEKGQDAIITRPQILEALEEIKVELKLKFEDLSEEDIEELRGPRGHKGNDGRSFSFDDHQEAITNILTNYVDQIKSELHPVITEGQLEQIKLKFSDLTEEEKDTLKLKFSDLSEEEIASLKVVGPKGPRGFRGQKGNIGERGPQGIQGIQGLPGAMGLRGLPGLKGLDGVNGVDGKDGEDAPIVVDIAVRMANSKELYFIFYFSDGTSIETNNIPFPVGAKSIHNYVGMTSAFPLFTYTQAIPAYDAEENIIKVTYYKPNPAIPSNRIVETIYNYVGDNVSSEVWTYYRTGGVSPDYSFTINYTYTGDLVTNIEVVW